MKTEKCLSRLFVSNTRRKIINILFSTPWEIFYVRQLVRSTGEEINSVRRELKNLSSVSLVKSERRGNRLYYWANPQNLLFPVLLSLANQCCGLGQNLSSFKKGQDKIHLLAYGYNFAVNRRQHPDEIDLIIVGRISASRVEKYIKLEEKKRQTEINYMVMSPQELQLRKLKRDPFMVNFFINCPLIIIGSPRHMANA